MFSQYSGTNMCDSPVGEEPCAEAGRKITAGETGHGMARGYGGAGLISVRNNKRQNLGP